MSIAYPTDSRSPDAWTFVEQLDLTPEEKTAAVTKVQRLEQQLFDGARARRPLIRRTAEALLAELNQVRATLGWLEIDAEGRWRWPHSIDC